MNICEHYTLTLELTLLHSKTNLASKINNTPFNIPCMLSWMRSKNDKQFSDPNLDFHLPEDFYALPERQK